MGETTGMIAIIGIAIIAKMTTGIARTTGVAMTATTGAIDSPKPVQRR
jgi:hypothetical protein